MYKSPFKVHFFRLLAFLLLISCTSGGSGEGERAEDKTGYASNPSPYGILPFDTIVNRPSGSFFCPSGLPSGPVPLLLFFDPQGNGSLPLKLYSSLAKRYGVILAGSGRVRNGLPFSETRLFAQDLVTEAVQTVPGGLRGLYLAGFSGGAKVAFDVAPRIRPAVDGILYAGAPSATGEPEVPVLGFAGKEDMNLADVFTFDRSLSSRVPHFLELTEGKHTWPAAENFEKAFVWIKYRRHVDSTQRDSLVNAAFQTLKSETDPFRKESALLWYRFLSSDVKPNEKIQPEDLRFTGSPEYQKFTRKRAMESQTELALKENYSARFFDKDEKWWISEIEALKAHKKHSSPALQERLLGYFSLASYGLSHRALQEKNLDLAGKILLIYRLADPTNPEQAYLWAVYSARLNRMPEARIFLKEAVELGFRDGQRIRSQSEFFSFSQHSDIQEMVDSLDHP